MPQTSPVNTATAAGAAAIIAPVVSQIAAALHLSLTPDVLAAIVIVIVAGAHWVGQQFAALSQLLSGYIAAKEAALLTPPAAAPTSVVIKATAPAPTVSVPPVLPASPAQQ